MLLGNRPEASGCAFVHKHNRTGAPGGTRRDRAAVSDTVNPARPSSGGWCLRPVAEPAKQPERDRRPPGPSADTSVNTGSVQ